MVDNQIYIDRAERAGYIVTGQSVLNPSNVWVKSGMGEKLKSFKEEPKIRQRTGMPAVHFENSIGSQHKYMRYDGKKAMDPECLEDYADEKGRKHWHRYVVKEDGTEGPAPFRSKAERKDYENVTGLRQREKGEERDDARKKPKKKPRRVLKNG